MLSRLIGPALRISARRSVTALTRDRIQPCLQHKLNLKGRQNNNTAIICNIYPTTRCVYLSTKLREEDRDQRKAEPNLDEELTNLQNNSEKNHISALVEFIKKASKLQRIDLANKAFELGKNSKNTAIYNAIIRAHANDGAVDKAEELFSLMTKNDIPIDANTHAGLILAHGKTNNESKLADYLTRVSDGTLPQEEPIYTALIAAYVALRDMETAEKLFEAMKQLEVTPSVRTFELMVQGYSQLNSLDQAYKTLNSMKANNIKPSLVLIKTMMTTCARLNDVSLARTLFASLQQSGVKPDAELWNEMIKIYCHAEQLDDADRALKAMRANGLTPSNASHAEFLAGLLKSDQITRAEAYFNSIRHDADINNRVWGRGIEIYLKLKNLDQAFTLVDECLEKKINLESRVRNLLWSSAKKKQRVDDYLKRFEKVPGNVSLETLQKEGHLKMSQWTKMRIENLENDETLPEEIRNQKFNPKDWEIIDDPFSSRATPPKSEIDETAAKLKAIETELVQKIEELSGSMRVEKQKSKADLNREAFKHMDKVQVFDLSAFDVEGLKNFGELTSDIKQDIEDFNAMPKTDKRAKKKESVIIGKLEERVLELLNKQRVTKLTPAMSAQIQFSAENNQLDPNEEEDFEGDEDAEPVERKKVVKKIKTVKSSGVKAKKKSSSVKSKVKSTKTKTTIKKKSVKK